MKVIPGDIKDAFKKGQISGKDYIKVKRKSIEAKKNTEQPKEKGPNVIRESIELLKKAIEDNNKLIQANTSIMQSAVNLMQEIKENLKKEPPKPSDPWDKIHVDVKRNKEGKIKSVEMKRKD